MQEATVQEFMEAVERAERRGTSESTTAHAHPLA